MGRIWLQLWTGDTLPLCKAHASNGPRGPLPLQGWVVAFRVFRMRKGFLKNGGLSADPLSSGWVLESKCQKKKKKKRIRVPNRQLGG